MKFERMHLLVSPDSRLTLLAGNSITIARNQVGPGHEVVGSCDQIYTILSIQYGPVTRGAFLAKKVCTSLSAGSIGTAVVIILKHNKQVSVCTCVGVPDAEPSLTYYCIAGIRFKMLAGVHLALALLILFIVVLWRRERSRTYDRCFFLSWAVSSSCDLLIDVFCFQKQVTHSIEYHFHMTTCKPLWLTKNEARLALDRTLTLTLSITTE